MVEAHDISHTVELLLQEELGAHATVHVDPKVSDHPDARRLQRLVEQAIARIDGLLNIHDLRVESREKGILHIGFE